MNAASSPQPLAVGEKTQNTNDATCPKQSYATQVQQKQFAASASKIELCPVTFIHGELTIEFTMDEVNEFTREEGLHQAVVIKFSYGKPDLQEIRRLFSTQFDVRGNCNIGQLDYRHLLVRFDLFTDYVQFLSRSTGYLKAKEDEYFFRTFPWTLQFNPKQETSIAVVWISMPGLPPNFFAKRSLMSIASAVGKALAVDKATQERTRPSTARVKVLLDLLDEHPKYVKLRIANKSSGKSIVYYQQIVYDNLPKYCACCKHQGHDETTCRILKRNAGEDAVLTVNCNLPGIHENKFEQLKGDARDFLNAKRATNNVVEITEKDHNNSKQQRGQNVEDHTDFNAVSVGTATNKKVPLQVLNQVSAAIVEVQDDGQRLLKNPIDIPASTVFACMNKLTDQAGVQKNDAGRNTSTGKTGKSANLVVAYQKLGNEKDRKKDINGVPNNVSMVDDSKGVDKEKDGKLWNVVTSRKSHSKKAASTGKESPAGRQNTHSNFNSSNVFEALELDEARQFEMTNQNDNSVSKVIVPAANMENKATGRVFENKEMGVRPNDSRTYLEEEMTDNSCNVPTLFFSTPQVEDIIKKAQAAMMKHTNMVRQPLVTLNTSDIEIPSLSEHSFEKYEGDSKQLRLSTGMESEDQGRDEHNWLAKKKTWEDQIEHEDDEDREEDDERESTDYDDESDDDDLRSIVSPPTPSTQKKKLNMNAPAFLPRDQQQFIVTRQLQTASPLDEAHVQSQQNFCPNTRTTAEAGQIQKNSHTTNQGSPVTTQHEQHQMINSTSPQIAGQQHILSSSRQQQENCAVIANSNVEQQQQQRQVYNPIISNEERMLLEALDAKQTKSTHTRGCDMYEEGEEDNILQSHSGKGRKAHSRKNNWDGKSNEETIVRQLPMRMAKQKQVGSTTSKTSNRSRNK